MICTICSTESKSGKVKDGEFICDSCLRGERGPKKGEVLHTRYELCRDRKGDFCIAKATFLEIQGFWFLVDADKNWSSLPSASSCKELMIFRELPGKSSPLNACQESYEWCLADIRDRERVLQMQVKALSGLKTFCTQQGIELSEPEE